MGALCSQLFSEQVFSAPSKPTHQLNSFAVRHTVCVVSRTFIFNGAENTSFENGIALAINQSATRYALLCQSVLKLTKPSAAYSLHDITPLTVQHVFTHFLRYFIL